MSRLCRLPLFAALMMLCGNVLAAREARPEDIVYWRTHGPMIIVAVCIVGIIFMTLLIWWVTRHKRNR